MVERKRQLQVGKLILEELSVIFQKMNLSIVHQALVSITKVQVTPDLLEARVFLSIYNAENKESILNIFQNKVSEIRGNLGNQLRHQLRRIPVLSFHIDDRLDYAFQMEELFKKINKEKESNNKNEPDK